GRYDEAREAASKALEFATGTPFTGAVARAHVILAEIQIAQGELQGADERLRKAVAIARKAPNDENGLVVSLLTLGKLQLRMGRFAEARAVADEIVSLSAQYDFPFPERYDALVLAARAERGLGHREQAIAMYQTAIDAIEAARHAVAGSERQQRLFFEPFHSAYTEVADLLLEKGSVAEALTFAERAKGRVLLDAIGRERKSVEEALSRSDRERLAKLVKSLGEANQRVLALQAKKDTPADALDEAVAHQRLAQHELARFDAEIAGRDPRLRSVRASSTIVNAADIASLVERPDFAILEFIVQERVTHLLIVERRGITHRRIEVASADLDKRIDAFRGELASRNLRYRNSARALYDLLLAPAAAQLKGKRVLAIVPDNVLWRLPFEALLAPDRRFVIERAACFYIPSITIYRDMLARQEQAPGTDLVAAFGNPALEGTRDNVSAIYRSVDLGPLPEAEEEVHAIAKTWGPSTFVYTRDAAREDAARMEMQRARVVHFAAHGIFDDVNPMFSQIVLARDSGSQDDGVLQAWELMRLDLAADLVVLSACDTARGQYGAGEGLIGMSWALFAGGCPS
ncbi:MAG TPA: CHAT domain-containing protein, partial [Thermoanaerobaculia bacterium]|nr:CHAT domain-containing protein [Thermoanaerobaculia bacterium]